MSPLVRDTGPWPPRVALRLQRWIGHLLWYSGLTALARYVQHRRATARILAYHHILPPDDALNHARLPWTMFTQADAFARQMRYVARHYHPVALPDLVDDLTGGGRIRPGSVAITLDDGYEDQLLHAFPVLRAAGLPATLAVVAGTVADWRDCMPAEWEREQFATAERPRAACAAGVTLAAHTLTHQNLTACCPATLHAELAGSRRHVRAIGGAGDLFCYPGGMHNKAVRAAVAAAGYRAALSCEPGANSARTDPLALRRVLVGAGSDHFMAAQLAGLLDGPAWLYHRLNRLRLWRRARRWMAAAPAMRRQPACRCAAPPPPIPPPLRADDWPRVTIAVPTYNEHDTIDRCLRNIVAQDYPRDNVEVLVVDGGSMDDTVDRARRYAGVRILQNPARDAETAKEIGLRAARGDLFMYLDADAEFAQPGWLRAMVHPLRDDATLSATFTRFVARPRASALDRYLNYHPLQLSPLLRELCVDIGETLWAERAAYTACCFSGGRVPPVGLCLYRIEALRAVAAGTPAFRWVDVGVPALLAKAGHAHFAYVPDAGIHHGRSATLHTLVSRQQRNVAQVYFPTVDTREFRYIEFSSARAVMRLLLWAVRVNLLLPPLLAALRDSRRRHDVAGLYGFPLAVLETNGVALTFVRHPRGRALLRQGLVTILRALRPDT